ncbi:MAG: DUF1572 family protein [Pyrinomonadaceae bacterium]
MFAVLFEKQLGKLIEEINAYENEADIWTRRGEMPNSAGNLTLHLIGNLNHYIGANLGNSGYKRERDLEFLGKEVSRKELVKRIKNVSQTVSSTLSSLLNTALFEDYPEEFLGETRNTFEVLVSTYAHLNYHLGQIDYHRRGI